MGWLGLSMVLYHWRKMMPRRFDRYLLREMVGPFALALAGLILFILLNIILSLSDLMVDRGVGMAMMLRLILYKVPSLLVLAVPMAALFAVFLGLGRLANDREVMALESMGISLRRLMVPLLLAATLVAGLDFLVYNWAVPASEQAYQQTLRQIIFRDGAPRITANAFFRGPDNQYFYIRRYDEETGALHDVHIYDTTGMLFPAAEAQVTMITADEGQWRGNEWVLEDGRVYGFDREGLLVFSGRYASLSIPVDEGIADVLVTSRTPSEMSIRELVERSSQALRSGQRIDELIVEIHEKIALPLATLVFVMLGGTITLMFNPRSRAGGVVIALLLVGLFQGLLWWMETLGRRGAMNPALAAWTPNILFGLIGLFLFLRVDRLASRDIWNRIRRFIPFVVIFLAIGIGGRAAELPLELHCDELSISEDRTWVHAVGNVRATMEGVSLSADALLLEEETSDVWRIEASGDVELTTGESAELYGERIAAQITAGRAFGLESAEAEGFSGSSAFVNSGGEEHTLYFSGEVATIDFTEDGEIERIVAGRARITSCNCCGVGLTGQPYSIEAKRLILYPDKLLVAYGLIARIAGVGILWLPVYVQPLEETIDSPLFPAIGRSSLRGWFLKWSVPFFVSESLYGSVLVDVYSRYLEVGLGGSVHYDVSGHRGDLSVYRLPAVVGDSELSLSWQHSMRLDERWNGEAEVEYELIGDEETFHYGARLDGEVEGWAVDIEASRTIVEEDDEEASIEITERIPEVSVSGPGTRIGGVDVRPSLAFGQYREWLNETITASALRVRGGVNATVSSFRLLGVTFSPTASAYSSHYETQDGTQQQTTMSATIRASVEGVSVSYSATSVSGGSPFEFDAAETSQQLSWSITRAGTLRLVVSGGFDLDEETIDPMAATLSWGTTIDWRATGEWNVEEAGLAAATLIGQWAGDGARVSWKIPWNVDDEWGRIAIDGWRETERVALDVALRIEDGVLDAAEVELEQSIGSAWGVTANATYDRDVGEALSVGYGAYIDVAECLRFGVERSGSETWVYASILAFPEAVLRYAPATSRFDLGD